MKNHDTFHDITGEEINEINDDLMDKVINDSRVRQEICRDSHQMFFNIHLRHYVKHEAAPFHKELFSLTEDNEVQTAVVVAFRGSAKSTIMNLSYPIWSILGKPQKKFILILGRTQQQARQHLKNIKEELEVNELLKQDLGPFEHPDDQWRLDSIVIPKYNAKIMCASSEQSIRGIRHKQHRPDLIICDDIDDLESVKTKDSRNKLYNWLKGEVIPAGDQNTKLIVIGNLLHDDSLIMRLKRDITEGPMDGIFRQYPLLKREIMDNENDEAEDELDDEDDSEENKLFCLWPGKYPTEESVEKERRKIGDERSWQREFMLNIVADEDQIVHSEWLRDYHILPPENDEDYPFVNYIVGVDLAISQRDSADYTSMVVGKVYGYEDDMQIYIMANPINLRITNLQTVDNALMLGKMYGIEKTKFYIEDVGYQKSVIEQFKNKGLDADGFPVRGQDKRARLNIATNLIQAGKVHFPATGAEDLKQQLLGFGTEKHDDLVDAFTMVIIKAIEDNGPKSRVFVIRSYY